MLNELRSIKYFPTVLGVISIAVIIWMTLQLFIQLVLFMGHIDPSFKRVFHLLAIAIFTFGIDLITQNCTSHIQNPKRTILRNVLGLFVLIIITIFITRVSSSLLDTLLFKY